MVPLKKEKMNGELEVTYASKNGKTFIKDVYQKAPLKASRGLYKTDDGRLTMYIMESSGGFVAGDSNQLSFLLEKDSRVIIHPQAATKVYPALDNEVSRQTINITLQPNTMLTWQREEVIPFEGAVFDSHTAIQMDSTASLWWEEILYPGREKRGESFAFNEYSTMLEVWIDDECLIYDPIQLDPKRQKLTSIGVMENFHFIASLWIVNPGKRLSETDIQATLNPTDRHIVSVSAIDERAFLIRWLSNHLPLIKKDMEYLQRNLGCL
ncbi:urease accessory protein [Gracilibacillus ureilyticus]|uniref:Urease accessory protein UreD n=1 Tax=Gracilibacillus ureilyticus TaxID=531814 RepID=A0A1H9US84_9BACI|nr:urease accessory protein UreD [Gracilibacillus ureilyticus]SES12272.1 urease accessory protein [Gracilibacillus ureilyticus]